MEDITKNKIIAKEYTLDEILKDKKYTVDYFQREYSWNKENIEQLIIDLTNAFLNDYKSGDETKAVANYNNYYMGSIVLYEKGGELSIIDGQQRITSLTLLLIYLYQFSNKTLDSQIRNLILSDSFGELSFNIQVPEREACLKALFNDGSYTVLDSDDSSTINMVQRYENICDFFPKEDIHDEILKSFVYWLKAKIIIVKITALSEDNAYTIFETMNDRGLNLTQSEMLKGFILSKYDNEADRKFTNEVWKKDILSFNNFDKETDSVFFQSWFRAKFADTIRQSKVGSLNMDFESIGTRFHNWFKENFDKGLLKEAIHNNIKLFVDNNYSFYRDKFILIKNAEILFDKDLEHVFYIKRWGIAPSLAYPLLLSPLCLGDDPNTCKLKIDLVAKYIDGFVVRRSTNFKNFGASSIRYTMCTLTKEIRNTPLHDLQVILSDKMKEIDESLNFKNALQEFHLHGTNGYFIKYYLCRLTAFIDEGSGNGFKFELYMDNPGAKPYEIEHIWCDHFNMHKDEFEQENDFKFWRNKIGALLLLPRGANQSYNDMPYTNDENPEKGKKHHYIRENILAQSLCNETYLNNPNFLRFKVSNNLPFQPHQEFKKNDITARCTLYALLSELIWPCDLK